MMTAWRRANTFLDGLNNWQFALVVVPVLFVPLIAIGGFGLAAVVQGTVITAAAFAGRAVNRRLQTS